MCYFRAFNQYFNEKIVCVLRTTELVVSNQSVMSLFSDYISCLKKKQKLKKYKMRDTQCRKNNFIIRHKVFFIHTQYSLSNLFDMVVVFWCWNEHVPQCDSYYSTHERHMPKDHCYINYTSKLYHVE